MRKYLVALLVCFAAIASGAPPPWYHSPLAGIAVGPVNTTVTFTNNHSGGDNAAFKARRVEISARAGSDTCYFDLSDGVATTDDHMLAASQSYTWTMPSGYSPAEGLDSIGVICAGTLAYKTATYTDANAPANNDTLVITDGVTPKTYRYRTTAGGGVLVEGDVLCDTSDGCADNLASALNGTAGAGNAVGGNYLVAAANPLMSAVADHTGAGTGTLTFTARVKGTAPASWAGNETSAGAAWFASFTLDTGGGTQDDATWDIDATR